MGTFEQYDLVRVIGIRGARFENVPPTFERHPLVGDVGTVVDVYENPPGLHVEFCAGDDGVTTWLEILHPDEVEAAG